MIQKLPIIACICLVLGLGVYRLWSFEGALQSAAAGYAAQTERKKPAPKPIAVQSTRFESGAWHTNITATVFWVGETASSENGFISNQPSAWDENWAAHAKHENPYYVALPYNDIDDDGNQKPEKYCAPFSPQPTKPQQCKNTWLEINYKDKTVYAQWEDVGPFGESDSAYVFGGSAPANHHDTRAGIDLSPAVQGHLGMGDVGLVNWRFVTIQSVPNGPWKDTVTATTY